MSDTSTAYFLGRAKVDKTSADQIPLLEPRTTTVKPGYLVTTSATGSLGGGLSGTGVVLYHCPIGYEAWIHRITVNASGYSPGSPLTSGEIVFYRNGLLLHSLEFFLPVSGVVAPVIMTEGKVQATLLRSGEDFIIYGDGLPDNLAIGIGLQITLNLIKTPCIPKGIVVGADHPVDDDYNHPDTNGLRLAPDPVE